MTSSIICYLENHRDGAGIKTSKVPNYLSFFRFMKTSLNIWNSDYTIDSDPINPLTLMNDQDRISPHKILTILVHE